MSIDFERKGAVALVTINRPAAMNALDVQHDRALAEVWKAFEADATLLVAVLTGAGGRAFCSGGDLKTYMPWRREVAPGEGQAAVAVARGSDEFEKIAAAAMDRPRHLGDLEAVSWTPPCESGHARWTLDVWYLLAFDGRVGSGRSLLVDLADKQVIRVRDFSVRAG